MILVIALGALVYYRYRLAPSTESKADLSAGVERQKSLAVKIDKVQLGDLEEKIVSVGSVAANASVILAPKLSGRMESVLVEVGDPVKKGDLIAQLDRREIEQEVREAEASLKVAQAGLKGKEAALGDLRRKLERAEALVKRNFIPRQEVDTLKSQVQSAMAEVELGRAQINQMRARLDNARIRLADTRVYSPFGGYVGKRHIDPGAMVSPTTPVVTIVDIFRVKVVLPVAERDYGKIRAGSSAAVTVDAYPKRRFSGTVARLSPVVNQETRTAEIEVELRNPGALLKPGMFAKVEIVTDLRKNVLIVPDVALVAADNGHSVYKVGEQGGPVERVSVKPGLSHNGWVEVSGQLNAGDRVVTLGSSLLKDGQPVAIAAKESGL